MDVIKRETIYGVIIITLIILRFIPSTETNNIVSTVNCIGMELGFFSIQFELMTLVKDNEDKENYDIFTGVVIVLLLITCVLDVLIFAKVITCSNCVNDIVTLFALLFCVSHHLIYNIGVRLLIHNDITYQKE